MIEKPVRVSVDPFGTSHDGVPNIFIVDAEGTVIAIIAQHSVWKHLQEQRMSFAQEIVEALNRE